MARYPLDGSETRQANRSGTEVKSKTRWDGVALVTETTQPAPRGDMTFKTRQVRTLSADGKTMTLTTSMETPRGPATTTVTFVRK